MSETTCRICLLPEGATKGMCRRRLVGLGGVCYRLGYERLAAQQKETLAALGALLRLANRFKEVAPIASLLASTAAKRAASVLKKTSRP